MQIEQTQSVNLAVTALIPAWNEEETIAATIKSIHDQTIDVQRIVVIVNNTTDNTAEVAKRAGAEVLIMENNLHKKAGALNYALDYLSKDFDSSTLLLIMDADTTLDTRFTEVALQGMKENRRAGGVSSVFEGRNSRTLLGTMQQMEYFRYKRDIRRNGDRAFVMSGTASMIRWIALRDVKVARNIGKVLPEGGSYYDTASLTEDNELTFALLTLGWECPAPGAISTTDVMESMSDLEKQRRRWYLGALGNIWNYGTKLPWHLRWVYWRQQFGLLLSVLTCSIVLVALGLSATTGEVRFSWFFTFLLGLHLFERIATVWKMGRRYRIIALLYFPELFYVISLLGIYILAVTDHARGRTGSWHTT